MDINAIDKAPPPNASTSVDAGEREIARSNEVLNHARIARKFGLEPLAVHDGSERHAYHVIRAPTTEGSRSPCEETHDRKLLFTRYSTHVSCNKLLAISQDTALLVASGLAPMRPLTQNSTKHHPLVSPIAGNLKDVKRRRKPKTDELQMLTHVKVSWDKFPDASPEASLKESKSTKHFLEGLDFLAPNRKSNMLDLMRNELNN